MDKLIRHGIIGLGKTVGIAASHIDALRKSHSLVLTAVYDKVPQNARDMLRRMGMTGVTVCDSVEQLFAMVDSVSICTPNDQHVELAVEALRQGLHVLVEKPLADSAQAAAFSPLWARGVTPSSSVRKRPSQAENTAAPSWFRWPPS